MYLIGISGYKQSGKDCVCEHLKNHFPKLERIAFADALKDEVCRAMLISRKYLEENKDNFRLILQGWGTDYRRRLYGDGYWIRQWYGKVVQSKAPLVVCPDVRFVNEAEMIRNGGGFLWRVDRPSNKSEDSHASEIGLRDYNKFDKIILNDRGIPQLWQEVDLALAQIGLI